MITCITKVLIGIILFIRLPYYHNNNKITSSCVVFIFTDCFLYFQIFSLDNGTSEPYTHDAARLTSFVFLCVIDAICVVGNAILLTSFMRCKQTDIRHQCLLSMVLASLLVGVVYVPVTMVYLLYPHLLLGAPRLCAVSSWLQGFAAINFITSMDCVSVTTYLSVLRPLRAASWLRSRTYRLILAGAWLLSALVSALPVVVQAALTDKLNCAYVISRFSYPFTIVLIFGIVLPSILLLVLVQTHIFCIARRHARQIRKSQVISRDLRESKERTRRGSTRLALYLASFLFVWTPLSCLMLLQAFCPGDGCISHGVAYVSMTCCLTTGAILPVVYAACSAHGRDAIKKLGVTWCQRHKRTRMNLNSSKNIKRSTSQGTDLTTVVAETPLTQVE